MEAFRNFTFFLLYILWYLRKVSHKCILSQIDIHQTQFNLFYSGLCPKECNVFIKICTCDINKKNIYMCILKSQIEFSINLISERGQMNFKVSPPPGYYFFPNCKKLGNQCLKFPIKRIFITSKSISHSF